MKKPRVAALDSNVLLLWLAGLTDLTLLTTWKRVDVFDESDYSLLSVILEEYRGLLTTPHILAEVSNFVDQAPLYRRRELILAFHDFAGENAEHYEKSSGLVGRPEFQFLALGDTGLVSLSSQAVVITTDYKLANEIGTQRGHAVNFNHLRGLQLIPGR